MQGNISSSSSIINCLCQLDCLDFSHSAGDFILSSGGGFDASTSSCSPSWSGEHFSLSSGGGLGGVFCNACSLSSGDGLGDLFYAACSLSSSSGLGDLFCAACSLSSGGGLGDLFCAACTLSSDDTLENGSTFNSNVSSSSTILHCLELDSLSCLLHDAMLFCARFSASCLLTPANSHCLGETHTSPGECHMHLDFEMSSIFSTYKQSLYPSL